MRTEGSSGRGWLTQGRLAGLIGVGHRPMD